MLSNKEKAQSIVKQIDIKNNSQWHFKTADSNCEKWLKIITNTPVEEAINQFAKVAILDFLRTTIITNCPKKWQPKRVDLTIAEAANWINLVPVNNPLMYAKRHEWHEVNQDF